MRARRPRPRVYGGVAAGKIRLDRLLVDRGLCESRTRAQALIMAGKVVVGEHAASKSGALVAADADVRVRGQDHPFVSRGGVKLRGALEQFAELAVAGRVAMDIGASTGGFTDCLLQAGAARVYAVDVGYGQLAWKLAQDPRVVVLDRTNIRTLAPATVGEQVTLAVADCSFISLTKVLPSVPQFLAPDADVVVLIKPQFEVGAGRVGKGGVVRDAGARDAAVSTVIAAAGQLGFVVAGICDSPITGQDGNVEFFAWLRWGSPGAGCAA
jgi:23S rRNA (cytidine1920-2'-O)/16S rRNA (cytidine1409-2'-O)-methyltransferase